MMWRKERDKLKVKMLKKEIKIVLFASKSFTVFNSEYFNERTPKYV